jgi:hypothetical protein
MAYLVEQFTGDRGVQLGVESFTRALPWGSNWTKMRIGCRLATNGTATIPAYNFPLIGVCTGPEAWASSVTVDAVAWTPLNMSYANAVWSGSAPNYFYDYNGGTYNQCLQQKIGTTINYLGTYTGIRFCWSANPTALRSALMLDITKTSATNVDPKVWVPTNLQVIIDCPRSNFLAMMENESAPVNVSGYTQTYPLVRQVKDWDSVFFHWGHAVPTTTFYDMTAVRFY